MSGQLKVGIIGLGAIGNIHADSYVQAGAKIAAGCDIDKAKLTATADKYGVKKRFADYRDMLKTDIDAVSVCVPNVAHCEIALAAFKAGKHVLLEKPMAMNAAEGKRIVLSARKAGRVLQIGMVNRLKPQAQIVREYVEAGLLGEIYHMRAVLIRRRGIPGMGGWFTTKAKSGGGPMIDLGVHWFDLAMWLSGHWNPTSVIARTYAKFGPVMRDYKYVGMWAGPPRYNGIFDVEDYASGFVRFGNKATLSFDLSWAANAEEDSFVEILGEKGGVKVFSEKPLAILTEHNGRLADISPKFDANINPFVVQAGRFISACRGKVPPAATGEQGMTVMKLLDAIYASSKSGKEVVIR